MNNVYSMLRPRWLNVIQQYSLVGIRQLYTPASIGLTDYANTRQNYKTKTNESFDKFRQRMVDYTGEDEQKIVFTEDLKQMIHIAEDTEDDIALLKKMMAKFHSKNSHLRFGSFVFGPVVMRLYHHLNKPEEALEVYYKPELDGFFDQLVTHIVLMDLLFNHSMYQELVDLYKTCREKQLTFGKFPKSLMVPLYAALYKLNTPESCSYMMELWKEKQEMGHLPIRRVVCFAAALALNQNSPDAAVEILSCIHNQNFILVRSIKALADVALGRMDEALLILASVLTFDSPNGIKHTFPKDVISIVYESVKSRNNKELTMEFSRIQKQLVDYQHITNQTLDEHLCNDITLSNPVDKRKSVIRASFHEHDTDSRKYQKMFRPGLQELV